MRIILCARKVHERFSKPTAERWKGFERRFAESERKHGWRNREKIILFCVFSFLKKRMRKTAAEGFKNFAADGICLQIVADAKYAGDRRRAPQEGADLLDAATLRKVSCIAGAGQRGKPRVKHEDTSEGCIEVRPSVPSGSVDRRADHITKTRKITDDS